MWIRFISKLVLEVLLSLCSAATGVLWARSYVVTDVWVFDSAPPGRSERSLSFASKAGVVTLSHARNEPGVHVYGASPILHIVERPSPGKVRGLARLFAFGYDAAVYYPPRPNTSTSWVGHRRVYFPHWVLLLGLTALPVTRTWLALRRWRRRRTGRGGDPGFEIAPATKDQAADAMTAERAIGKTIPLSARRSQSARRRIGRVGAWVIGAVMLAVCGGAVFFIWHQSHATDPRVDQRPVSGPVSPRVKTGAHRAGAGASRSHRAMDAREAGAPALPSSPEVAFFTAIRRGDLSAVRSALEVGQDVNSPNFSGYSPLHAAVAGGHKETVAFLIDRGADVNRPLPGRGDGWTPLHGAVSLRKLDIAELLLSKGANINGADAHGRTPLLIAVRERYGPDVVAFLLEHGADPNRRDTAGDTALGVARRRQESAMIQLLMAHGATE
jgi:hypothetical protein